MVETTVEQLITALHSRGVKLWIEDDQLRSRAPKGAITPSLRDQVRDRKAEIIDFLRQAQGGVPQPSIQPVPRNGPLPLSYAQQRLWLLDQLGSGAAYNIPLALKLDGRLDPAALEQTLTKVVRRHESLRTTFTMIDDEARQMIGASMPVSLNLIDLRHLLPEAQEAEVKRLAAEEALAPFDLSRDLMLRAKLLQLAAEQHVLLLTMHHSASDGWSLGILVQEIAALYGSFVHGQPISLPELAIQYADFAVWQREWLQGEVLEKQLAYWQDQLAGAPQLLPLPTDHPRPPVQTFRGSLVRFRIGAELTRQLQQLSRQSEATLFMTLLAAFQILLMRYSSQEDIVVGSPIANRNRKEIEPLIGFFVNTLVLRTDLSGNPTFLELLAQVRRVTQAAYDHQDLPFERLVEALQPDRNLNHSPLVQVAFALQNAPLDAFELPGLRVSRLEAEVYSARLDLELHLWEEAGELDGYCIYNPDLFEAATLDRMGRHFQRLLAGIVANPQQRIADLPLLTEAERHQILVEWNDTRADYPKDKCLHQLFEAQVECTPNAVALVFEEQQFTYRELNSQANQLAHHLRGLGIGPETPVAIFMEQSPEVIIGMLGILKAGGAYVPLDPNYPPAQLALTLQDIQAPVLLTQPWLLERLPDHSARVVCLPSDWEIMAAYSRENLESGVTANDLAYIIYTSGSTGRPKGVMMPHAALVLHFTWAETFYQWTAADRILQQISLSFDGSVLEIFTPLLCGATMVITQPQKRLDPTYLVRLIADQKITGFVTLPPILQLLLAEKDIETCQSLRTICCGGDVLTLTLQQQCFERLPAAVLYNAYGPTEAAMHSIAWVCRPGDERPVVPIGRPIGNTQVYVLDPDLRPVPMGVAGELYIGGEGLARGYLNDPVLTAQKFIPAPFSPEPGRRLYKTGDVVRYMADGNLEFLGRLDHQVKIRGFRIELGEIEANLTQHPGVREAKVVVNHRPPDDDAYLVAYVASTQLQAINADELRHFLQEKVPKHMIPSFFVALEEFPRISGGKIDERKLPQPTLNRSEHTSFDPPRGALEMQLTQIWEEVLGRQPIGVKDNFFDLGGHSLLATRLMSRLRQTFQLELPLRLLFEAPTVAGLAEYINRIRPDGAAEAAPAALPDVTPAPEQRYHPFPLTDVQHAYWLGRSEAFELGNVATHGYFEFESRDLDVTALNRAWQKMIERHEMLRMVVLPNGQQQILEEVPFYQIPVLDLTGLEEAEQSERLAQIRQDMSHELLPADRWPLFNLRITRLDGQRFRLHLSLDGLVCDGWSLFILFKEWALLYQNPAHSLPQLSLSFRDYILATRTLEKTELYQQAQAYWFNRLDTLPPAPELPLARNPALISSPRFNRRTYRVDPTAWQRLKERAGQTGLTPTGFLLAAFAQVLAKWSKQPQFTLNLTLFNRLPLHPQVNEIMGDFTSLTLLQVDYFGSRPFIERARQLQQQLWQDLDHHYVSGVCVLRELARRKGGVPNAVMPVVFTSALAFDSFDQDAASLEGFGELVYSIGQTPQVWLDHQVVEVDGALVLNWDAVEELFPEGLLDDMFEAYCRLLQQLAAGETAWSASSWSYLPDRQLARRVRVNATEEPLSEELLHTLFIKQVALRAGEVAVISPQRKLTYRELYQRASQVGHWLQEEGAKVNGLVGVVMEKGWEQVVAVLGIHLAGAAYLPIDPSLPDERQHYLLEQGQVELVLTQSWLDKRANGRRWLNVDELDGGQALPPLKVVQQPGDLAYVIYTSGSTGLPKGVAIDHRGAVNTVLDINRRFGVSSEDRVLALSALNFDLSVYDIFGLLAAGGTIIMPGAEGARDPAHWQELINRYGVTVWNTVPALIQMLVEYNSGAQQSRSSLRLVMLSGDWIPVSLPEQIKRLWADVEVNSLGGATEASIWSIYYKIDEVEADWSSIPYGRPLTNQTFHVLDEQLNPRPVWVAGDLYIGGIGLAQGYWRDEEKTKASFIIHPQTGERLYKTGDQGRYWPDGNIEFLGREDFQVKIRGHRIELGEIEAVLTQHPHIKEAVVAAVGEPRGHKQLVAYVVPLVESGPANIILDPLERLKFKLEQPGLRQSKPTETAFALPAGQFDETTTRQYLARQSYRQFQPDPIPLETLSQVLSCLRQMLVAGSPLPKYRYPSAGSLYPVQTYLYLKPNHVEGIPAGFYYYHPAHHQLVLLNGTASLEGSRYDQNQPIFESAAFALFQIGQLDAIEPMYGDRARDFCLLEAGYMGQLLMEQAPTYDIGLCPIGSLEFEGLPEIMGLTSNQIMLHSFLGGKINPIQTTRWTLDEPGQGKNMAVEQLQSYLLQKLPAYMVPATYIPLEALPLTPNGKVDRQALPAPDLSTSDVVVVPPETDMEQTLVNIIRDVLQIEEVGVHHNFFDLGADSVHLVEIRSKLQEIWGKNIPLVALFDHSTVSSLAKFLSQDSDTETMLSQATNEQISDRTARRKEFLKQQALLKNRKDEGPR